MRTHAMRVLLPTTARSETALLLWRVDRLASRHVIKATLCLERRRVQMETQQRRHATQPLAMRARLLKMVASVTALILSPLGRLASRHATMATLCLAQLLARWGLRLRQHVIRTLAMRAPLQRMVASATALIHWQVVRLVNRHVMKATPCLERQAASWEISRQRLVSRTPVLCRKSRMV